MAQDYVAVLCLQHILKPAYDVICTVQFQFKSNSAELVTEPILIPNILVVILSLPMEAECNIPGFGKIEIPEAPGSKTGTSGFTLLRWAEHESRRAARRHRRRPSSCHAPAILILCTSLSPVELPCSSFHSLLPRAQAELSSPVAAPAISGHRSSIPPTSICRASSSTHPRAHLSCSPTEIDSPRPPPLETRPHSSSSILLPFSA